MKTSRSKVSIHLMLLFISVRRMGRSPCDAFQYISCYSLSKQQKQRLTEQCSFNTSHVTLYRACGDGSADPSWFQYISCYSLSEMSEQWEQSPFVSIHLMLLFIIAMPPERNRNISFQYISCYSLSDTASRPADHEDRFQYISCYSLSHQYVAVLCYVGKFQYISCYSLSCRTHGARRRTMVSIHLMLLFIRLSAAWTAKKRCFNTSHVTLYRRRSRI